MSEYQYYEFQALDRPLDESELHQLRRLSTRASITPTSFVNVYNFGDFKGNPRVLMEKFFDAFVYVANWGTRWLMFRLPQSAVDRKVFSPYCVRDRVSIKPKGGHVILEFLSELENRDWEEGEGWLGSLVPLRTDILHGDLRALYIAWLLCVQEGDVHEKSPEPPVPSGLKNLSSSLRHLTEFLRVDEDLIAAAAEQSEDGDPGSASSEELLRLFRSLGERRKEEILLQFMQGNGQEVKAALLKAVRQRRSSRSSRPSARRSVKELLSIAETISSERRRRTAARAAKEQRRREREEEIARAKRLEKLGKNQAATWRQVETLIGTKQPKKYDDAVSLIRDLHELSIQKGKRETFESRLAELRGRHGRKPSLLERLDRTGLESQN